MPCYDPPLPPDFDSKAFAETQMRHKMHGLEERISRLTDMLCAVCTRLETLQPTFFTHELMDVGNWWFSHKRMDESRINREKEQREQQLLHKKRVLQELEKEIKELENKP